MLRSPRNFNQDIHQNNIQISKDIQIQMQKQTFQGLLATPLTQTRKTKEFSKYFKGKQKRIIKPSKINEDFSNKEIKFNINTNFKPNFQISDFARFPDKFLKPNSFKLKNYLEQQLVRSNIDMHTSCCGDICRKCTGCTPLKVATRKFFSTKDFNQTPATSVSPLKYLINKSSLSPSVSQSNKKQEYLNMKILKFKKILSESRSPANFSFIDKQMISL